VPREWLLEALATDQPAADSSAPIGLTRPDLTVVDLAMRYGRKPSTVRGWIERGEFPGAYAFHGREWRVPAAGLDAFEVSRRAQGTGRKSA